MEGEVFWRGRVTLAFFIVTHGESLKKMLNMSVSNDIQFRIPKLLNLLKAKLLFVFLNIGFQDICSSDIYRWHHKRVRGL